MDKRIKRDLGECSDRLGCPDALPTTYTAPVALRRRADEHLPNEFGPGLIEQSKMEWIQCFLAHGI